MIVLTLDKAGLLKAEIVAADDAWAEYHKLFIALRVAIETLDTATKAVAEEVADNAHRQ